MADTEFEEFRHHFERLPQHIKAPAHIYTLVHDVSPDAGSPTSPCSEAAGSSSSGCSHATALNNELEADEEDDGGGGGEEGRRSATPGPGPTPPPEPGPPAWGDTGQHRPERRRRKLPEIPKNKKSALMAMVQPSLADELGDAFAGGGGGRPETLQFALGACSRPLIVLKCHSYLRDEDSSPDSEYFHSTDVDSGNSTAHSPDGPKSMSPQLTMNVPYRSVSGSPSPVSPCSTVSVPYTQLELLEATHRGLHKFIPRHHDEIEVEIGDPIYVQKEADDLWCEGVNLRSGVRGIFPSAYVVDMDYSDFDPSTPKVKRERYLLGYLGSVETKYHKGNKVLCQAVRKIVGPSGVPKQKPHSCILEVSDQGLRMVDKRKPSPRDVPCHDYFYSLKNVSFCAFHPRDHRYLGFITKHPQFQRFACHVFMGCESTRPVAEAIGRAFQRFYTKFIETAYPIEDIYIE